MSPSQGKLPCLRRAIRRLLLLRRLAVLAVLAPRRAAIRRRPTVRAPLCPALRRRVLGRLRGHRVRRLALAGLRLCIAPFIAFAASPGGALCLPRGRLAQLGPPAFAGPSPLPLGLGRPVVKDSAAPVRRPHRAVLAFLLRLRARLAPVVQPLAHACRVLLQCPSPVRPALLLRLEDRVAPVDAAAVVQVVLRGQAHAHLEHLVEPLFVRLLVVGDEVREAGVAHRLVHQLLPA
mmetsp:Transcript_47374/g.120929  ORF Transcript_47374/g.120929 Transcript_47374/m.120929 type:complete len:234 (-) Transcript_47374:890-1591(-)